MDTTQTLVVDADVYLDLIAGGLLRGLFRLPYTVLAPIIPCREAFGAAADTLMALGAREMAVDGATLALAAALGRRHPAYARGTRGQRGPGRAGCCLLAFAFRTNSLLVSGDRFLAAAAEAEGVPREDTLWIAEQLVIRGLIAPDTAADAYRSMHRAGRHLPWTQAERQLRRLMEETKQ